MLADVNRNQRATLCKFVDGCGKMSRRLCTQASKLFAAVGGNYAKIDSAEDHKLLRGLCRQLAQARLGSIHVRYRLDPMKCSLGVFFKISNSVLFIMWFLMAADHTSMAGVTWESGFSGWTAVKSGSQPSRDHIGSIVAVEMGNNPVVT